MVDVALRPLRELLEGASITASRGDVEVPVRAVRHDSRRVEPGDVFFAIDGAKMRGLDFVDEAIRRGAAAVVASELAPGKVPVVAVDDIRRAMSLAACVAFGHPTRQVPTVGITGTNGKTTITYLLEAAFEAIERPAGVIGTINARLGDRAEVMGFTTPEAPELQRMAAELVEAGAQSLLMEVTSHGLKLSRVHGCSFRVVAFTNLTQDHLDLHGSMDDYAATKLTLFTEELKFSTGAVAVVNIDDALGQRIAAEASCTVVTVSPSGVQGADVRVVNRELTLGGVVAEFEIDGRTLEIQCPLIGEHNVSNLAISIGIAHALALPLDGVARGIAALDRVPGRVEPVHDPRGSVVLVDYAHTPDALRRVTETISAFTKGRLIVLFGCGGDRDRTKRPLMGAAASAHGDIVVVTSDNPRTEDQMAIIEMALPGVEDSGLPKIELNQLAAASRGFAVEPDRRRAIAAAVASARPDDVVLIAGKGHEDYQILGERRIHFDDREEATAAIEAIVAQGRREEVGESYENA